ncbi:MAG TPA: DUF5009 domain-containing protein [Verrucomicrobiota bacterium]|nr:DUF5009 domain-containing protein [Verrucomicrobiota bacterium]
MSDSGDSKGPASRPEEASGRLLSLDALRGFDMFWIVGADAVVRAWAKTTSWGPAQVAARQVDHADWAGFRFYDLIFPLFVFVVGVSLVFSLSRWVERGGGGGAVRRVVQRFLLLYLLGIVYYGGVSESWERIRLLGVLQRIGLAYLAAGLLFLFCGWRVRLAVTAGLLIGYWALMTFVPVPGVGAGDIAEGRNLANWIDQQYLPWRKWDGTHDPEGLLSTLPAIATCLLGVFAGNWLRDGRFSGSGKAVSLVLAGVVMVALGWLWSLQFPVIKKIWTSSFVLVAGGYSAVLLGVFYWVIDVAGVRRWAMPLVWIGMNPIAIYVIHSWVNLPGLARRLVGGPVQQAMGVYGNLLGAVVALGLCFWICGFLYRRRVFLRL